MSVAVDVLDEWSTALAVDTGFIVYNERTYPLFTRLLRELGVATKPSNMSFSVRCEASDLEYNGTTINSLFAQRRNLFRPSFHRMWRDILRFNRHAPGVIDAAGGELTLGDYVRAHGYSRQFIDHYLMPMAAAIWSATPVDVDQMPARFLVGFFRNHGMLTVDDRPQWRTIDGGAMRYVEKLVAPFRAHIRLNTPVQAVRRTPTHVMLHLPGGESQRFDQVVFACHSDQALALLRDPDATEREVLGAIPFQDNDVVLHTDARLLPRRPLARAAWNYHRFAADRGRATVTYNLTLLQRQPTPTQFLVTLNAGDAIDPDQVLLRTVYAHPVYNQASMAAQARWAEINGPNRSYFCGAYWGYGFHEDGVRSGVAVARAINGQGVDAELHLRRVG